jgi:hypothetical protein
MGHDEVLANDLRRAMRAREEPTPLKSRVFRPATGPSIARSLLQYAGTWEGDDLEECLRLVYATRSKARF